PLLARRDGIADRYFPSPRDGSRRLHGNLWWLPTRLRRLSHLVCCSGTGSRGAARVRMGAAGIRERAIDGDTAERGRSGPGPLRRARDGTGGDNSGTLGCETSAGLTTM